MDAFIRTHRSFLLSLLCAVTGILLLGYATVYRPKEVALADAARLTAILTEENRPLAAELARRQKSAAQPEAGIRSLPRFLDHINSIAQDTKVIIRELMPSRDGNLKFVLKITADYLTFLRFAANLEALNVSINDLQVRPFDGSQNPPTHAIEFSITPRADAAPLTDQRLQALRDQVAEQNKRNPFQRFAFNRSTRQVTQEIDLTWIHRLSGIGRVGDQDVATINTRDYRVGMELEAGLKVTKIDSDAVHLQRQTDDGLTLYVIRFRRSKLDAKAP